MEECMTTKEMAHLVEWLQAHGHTPEEVLDCIKYITHEPNPEK